MKLRWLAVVAAVALTGGCSVAASADPAPAAVSGAPSAGPPPMAVSGMPSADAIPASQAASVGALFSRDGSGGHYCTASVVASPGRDLLITAAHCINAGRGSGDYAQDIVFIPGYRDGQAPYGTWAVQRMLVAPQWISDSDPDLDIGFVVLQPDAGRNIQDVVGGSQLGTDSGYRYLARVTGYPDGADAPVSCVNWTSEQSATQLQFDCGGFPDGTSGSPWLTDVNPRTGTGTIVGVIGGYQQGGDTPAISYSSDLGDAVQRLYEQAIAGAGTAG
jgi:V8-like Glu-specific endopeptidase